MKLLSKAIYTATIAHKDQFDKAGVPYILHPLKLQHWLRCESEEVQVVAVLHDVVEDSAVTLLQIEKDFGPVIAEAVDCLTKRGGEHYDDYLDRVASNKISIKVKLADLRHNSDIRRLKGITQKDFARIQKYQTAYAWLKDQLKYFQ